MKSILVATDLSAGSERALRRAVVLAVQTGARATCLHVLDGKLAAEAADAKRQEAEAAIAAQLEGARDVPVSVKVVSGSRFESILAAAKDEAADLVVIGPHRSVTELDLFRGSTAERMLVTGGLPVLLVKQPVTAHYRRVLVAVDFSPPSRSAVAFAVENFSKAELKLVHAAPRMRPSLEADGAEFLQGLEAATLTMEMPEGPPVPTLMKAIERHAPDLVVVGTHGRTGTGPQQIGTVAERVLSQSAVDVLAVRG